MKKIKTSASLILMSTLVFFPIVSISCNTSSESKNIQSVPQVQKRLYVNVDELKFKYEYIHAFSKTQYDFDKVINKTPWTYDETIFKNDIFNIKFDSQDKEGEFFLDLYNYELNKWYFLKIYYDENVDLQNSNKKKLANDICSIITSNFLNDVSKTFKLTNDLVLNENEGKSKIIKDGYGSFKSSWGVWNDTTQQSQTQFIINEKMIKETSQIDSNDESFVFEEIKLNDFYYMPLIDVIDPPVGQAKWIEKKLSINGKLINSSLTNKTQSIILPKNADSGQEWWKWFTNGKNFDDVVISYVSDLIASTIDIFVVAATENPVLGYVVGEAISQTLDIAFHALLKDNLKNYNNNKMVIDDYNKTINEKGYKVGLSQLVLLETGKDNILILDSDVKYKAKATAIFGDRTKAKIYANPALAKTESKVRKYAVI